MLVHRTSNYKIEVFVFGQTTTLVRVITFLGGREILQSAEKLEIISFRQRETDSGSFVTIGLQCYSFTYFVALFTRSWLSSLNNLNGQTTFKVCNQLVHKQVL